MAMATHQPHPASHNGDLNQQTNAHAANGKAKHHRSAEEDDDSIATEQFPEFDPLHDGNGDEDEQHELPHYTHAVGIGTVAPQQHSSDSAHDHEQVEVDGEEDDEDEEDDDTRSLSPVEPLPEPSHPADDDDDDIHTQRTTPPPITSPMTSPPYWVHGNQQDLHSTSRAQQQNNHNLSSDSLVPHGGITLQDNEAEEDEPSPQHQQRLQHPQQATGRGSEEMRTSYGRDRNKACWARSVEVSSYVIVNGSTTNIGAFVVWNIRVQTLSVCWLCLWSSHL